MSRETVWTACARERAPEGVIVETTTGTPASIQKLKRRGNLWWLPDDSMYVYYEPTHWRLL